MDVEVEQTFRTPGYQVRMCRSAENYEREQVGLYRTQRSLMFFQDLLQECDEYGKLWPNVSLDEVVEHLSFARALDDHDASQFGTPGGEQHELSEEYAEPRSEVEPTQIAERSFLEKLQFAEQVIEHGSPQANLAAEMMVDEWLGNAGCPGDLGCRGAMKPACSELARSGAENIRPTSTAARAARFSNGQRLVLANAITPSFRCRQAVLSAAPLPAAGRFGSTFASPVQNRHLRS
jgi:hypothetical protein